MIGRRLALTAIMALFLVLPMHSFTSAIEEGSDTTPRITAYVPDGPWDRDNWTRYRNLNDTYNEFDILLGKFPNILRKYNLSDMYRHPNGTPRLTVRGRTIWALKVSDDPDINDSSEPDIFYCSMTHAREWISGEVLIYYLNYVLHNYLVNSTVNDAVNNTEMWFIPIVNPDGFQESIDNDDFNNSYGRFGWRKNVNETNGIPGYQNYGSATGDGVDLNRNFGYQWIGQGSSTNPDNLLYRGASPFSEVETQIIRELALDREFDMALSFHSYSGLVLYPWGYTTDPAPERSLLMTIAQNMAAYNGYQAVQGAVLYPVNGEFGDWMYGQLNIPTFTIEINGRNSRYIPEIEMIETDCKMNREACFVLPKIASDPYSIFQAGINAATVDEIGDPVPNASVNLTGIGRTVLLRSDQDGRFNVSLEPGSYQVRITANGGYTNETTTLVTDKTYIQLEYILLETTPPVVESINVLDDEQPTTELEWGANYIIEVKELYNESGLTGHVDVYDLVTYSKIRVLDLTDADGVYRAEIDTSGLDLGKYYGLEAILIDKHGNTDMNGSVNSGLDLIVTIVDTIPPVIYKAQVVGDDNPDGSFEFGTDISVEVYVEGGSSTEPLLTGNFTFDGIRYDMKWGPGSDLLWGSIPGRRIGLGQHTITPLVADWLGNQVNTSITFVVNDTTPPVFSIGALQDITQPVPQGTEVTIAIYPEKVNLSDTASIELFMETSNGTVSLGDLGPLKWSQWLDAYTFPWNTTGIEPGIYFIEGRLTDNSGNFRDLGAISGLDMTIRIVDLTPPILRSIEIEGIDIQPGGSLGTIGPVRLEIFPEIAEPELTCFMIVTHQGSPVIDPVLLKSINGTSFSTVLDLAGYGFRRYDLEFQLFDTWGNMDPDGYGTGIDLSINFTRGGIEQSFHARIKGTDYGWEMGEKGWVVQGEEVIFESIFSNTSLDDGFQFISNGLRSDLTWIKEINGTSTRLIVTFPTSLIAGSQVVWWRLDLPDQRIIETGSMDFKVIESGRLPVVDLSLSVWDETRDDDLLMNLTWSDPPKVSGFLIRVSYNDGPHAGDVHKEIMAEPGQEQVSIGIERFNLTVEIISIHYLFPSAAGRNVTLRLSDSLGSKLTLVPPKMDDQETSGDSGDQRISLVMIVLLFFISVVIAVMIAGVILMRRNRSNVDWEME